MSLRLRMLQAARLAPSVLGESRDLIVSFLRGQMNPDGGFGDRAGRSDVYYTVFGLESLMALGADIPFDNTAAYLRSLRDGAELDFVHIGCLARCWADLPAGLRADAPREAILRRLQQHRSGDGGFHTTAGTKHGTIYGCFLATAAYQDLGAEMPDPQAMLGCLEHLRTHDGGYANQDDMPVGLTPATAAAVVILRDLGRAAPAGVAEWLLSRCQPTGGFYASPMAPVPDLLSTATALHALAALQADLTKIKEPCLDFIDSLWTNTGAFYGNWSDDALDCEYTYYALLALGHLSL